MLERKRILIFMIRNLFFLVNEEEKIPWKRGRRISVFFGFWRHNPFEDVNNRNSSARTMDL